MVDTATIISIKLFSLKSSKFSSIPRNFFFLEILRSFPAAISKPSFYLTPTSSPRSRVTSHIFSKQRPAIMEAENSIPLDDLIHRVEALEFALAILPTAAHKQSERADSLQQSPSRKENKSSKSLPVPSEGEWIAADLPFPRRNATSIQRRRNEVARELSPIFHNVENGDEGKVDEEEQPPRPTTAFNRRVESFLQMSAWRN